MPRKYDKRRMLQTIEPMRACGMTGYKIHKATGISATYVYRLIKELELGAGSKCPHCGEDTKAHPQIRTQTEVDECNDSALNDPAGELRPKES
jgi:hypothetical protein